MKTRGGSPVKRKVERGAPNQVVNGEEVFRRQLSQWQCPRQFSGPSYSNLTDPQRQRPEGMPVTPYGG
jgi:hypothetical protein